MSFDEYRRERQMEKTASWNPSRTHTALVKRKPTHVKVGKKIGRVLSYKGDLTWACLVDGRQVLVHELDANFVSQDVMLYESAAHVS